MKSWWIVAVAATVGDAGVEGAVAAVCAVGLRDQLEMDNLNFAEISGCNLALAGARYFGPDGLAEWDSPA